MKIRKALVSLLGAISILVCAAAPQLIAATRDAGTIVVDGKTFSSSRNCKGDNWSYDASSHTLTLDGYSGMYIDLGTQDQVVVEVKGSPKVTSQVAAPAIMVEGSLLLQGEGPLFLETDACHSAAYARNGDLTVNVGTMFVTGKGEVTDSAYLLMADGNVHISDTTVHIEDGISGSGGAVGSNCGEVKIGNGSNVSIDSKTKGITALEDQVYIEGKGTVVSVSSDESSIYAKKGITISSEALLEAECRKQEGTAVYCPEGKIALNNADAMVTSQGCAIAGESISFLDCFISYPEESETKLVSSMVTVISGNNVAAKVNVTHGVAPTATPSPTPTPTPVPTPTLTPVPENAGPFSEITPRMLIGAGLLIVALTVFAVIILGKIRGRD